MNVQKEYAQPLSYQALILILSLQYVSFNGHDEDT